MLLMIRGEDTKHCNIHGHLAVAMTMRKLNVTLYRGLFRNDNCGSGMVEVEVRSLTALPLVLQQ